MSRDWKWIIGGTVALVASAALILAFAQASNSRADEKKEEKKAQAVQEPTRQGEQVVVAMDASTQALTGIRVDTLHSTTQRLEVRASAVVLPMQELTDLRKSYLSAGTEVEKAKLSLNVSRQEYERLKALYQEDQNASAKAVQAAEATWRTDEANLRAAQNAIILAESTVRQNWGGVVARWFVEGSPALDRILAQRDFLLQVSLTPVSKSNAPATASIQMQDGGIQSARLVSPFPRVDPRIQSPTFLYLTPRRRDLAAGMALVVLLPSGPATRGVVIPGSATVWWQGKVWAYVQSAPGRFSRREVSTQIPAGDGWFVTGGFSQGDKVVVSGAQQLLSEELRPQAKALGEEGEKE